MSDLCAYKLEDIDRDEVGGNDHHIVPHISNKKKGCFIENDFNKKPRYDLSHSENTLNYNKALNNDTQRKDRTNLTTVPMKEEHGTMLEIRASCSASDDDGTSNQCLSSNMDSICSDSCADDSILGGQTTDADNSLFYQLNNSNQSDMDPFDNNLQDKENNDLLYYGWPEIENFDEVDRMFRSCDSTFGLDIDNGDDLGWFSSSLAMEGSDDVLKSSFGFSGCDRNAVNNVLNDQRLTLADLKGSFQELNPNSLLTVVNSSGIDNHVDNDLQIQSGISQSKHQKPTDHKRKEMSLYNGDSLFQVGESSKSLDFQNSFSHEQQKNKHQINIQAAPNPLINTHPSNQLLVTPSSPLIRSSIDLQSISFSKSNEMQQCAESSHDISFHNPGVSENDKKDLAHEHKSSRHTERRRKLTQISDVENDVDGLSEVNGSNLGMPREMDTSNVEEGSCMSSVDEVSVEASSFQRLQQVLEQVDVRTKLCIRDSLYRLARSAEQRHKCVSQTNNDGNGPVMDKCTGYMDIETETNPIDRSIAHLLFHRPSNPSGITALDAAPTKSYPMVDAPHIGPMMTEKPVYKEATAGGNEGR